LLCPELVSHSESNEVGIRDSIFEILDTACRAKPNSVSKDFVKQVYKDLQGLRRRLGEPLNSKVALKFDYYEVIEPPHQFYSILPLPLLLDVFNHINR
jgi:hypothetical protein